MCSSDLGDGLGGQNPVTNPFLPGGPLLRIFSVDDAADRDNYICIKTREIFAFDPTQRAGLRVSGVLDLNGDGRDDFIVATGQGVSQQVLGLFTTDTPEPPPESEFTQVGVVFTVSPVPFDPNFTGGLTVGG